MPAYIQVKSILNKKKNRDTWFLDDYTVNAYSGCSFNCLYCYIRGSKYGINMQDKLSLKTNAIELLDKQLAYRARKRQYGFIVLSSATDPYLQFEEGLQYTRKMLDTILKHRFPVHIITKSNLVVADLDLLAKINEHAYLPRELEGRVPARSLITFSFSTVSDEVAKIFEPGAPLPSVRLKALQTATTQGFYAGISLMPLLPFISDTTDHLEQMFTTFRDAYARYVMPAPLTLFGNKSADSRTLVFRAIDKHFPHLSKKYRDWFENSSEPPSFYQQAFEKKLNELSEKYCLPNRISKL